MAKAKKTSKKTKAKKLAKLAPPYDKVTRADVITGATKGKSKKEGKNKKVVKENVLIANFIKCVSEENYAEANKYLKQVIEDKLMKRISQAIKPTLF